MRTVDCTRAFPSEGAVTLMAGLFYEVGLKDNQFYTGKLHSFFFDGNTIEHLTLTFPGERRLLIFCKDIVSIRRAYVHY